MAIGTARLKQGCSMSVHGDGFDVIGGAWRGNKYCACGKQSRYGDSHDRSPRKRIRTMDVTESDSVPIVASTVRTSKQLMRRCNARASAQEQNFFRLQKTRCKGYVNSGRRIN
jgi:hypothetical protein